MPACVGRVAIVTVLGAVVLGVAEVAARVGTAGKGEGEGFGVVETAGGTLKAAFCAVAGLLLGTTLFGGLGNKPSCSRGTRVVMESLGLRERDSRKEYSLSLSRLSLATPTDW